jgi:ribosome maturation factor RimP
MVNFFLMSYNNSQMMISNINEMEIFISQQAQNIGLAIRKFTIWRSTKNIPNIDILVERDDYELTNVGECVKIHKIANLWLKNMSMLGKVNVVVRSPGIDRELLTLEDYQRFLNSQIKIKLKDEENGRRNLQGFLKSLKDEMIVLEIEGRPIEIAFQNVEKANIVPDWGKIFKEAKNKD